MENGTSVKKNKLQASRRKDAIFCSLILAYPLLHFAIFYIYVNFSSFAMAFQYYYDGEYIFDWGKQNLDQIIYDFKNLPIMVSGLKNSAIVYFCSMLIGEPLAILFSYCIYKKIKGTKFFKIILFMPTIIPGLVLCLIYKYFVDDAIPEIMYLFFKKEMLGLLTTASTMFGTVLFYTLFMGFGPKVLVYSSTMSGINESIVESAQLDGISFARELVSITIPMIFATITTYIVASIATFVTNQMNLFNFFAHDALPSISTFGYYLYVKTQIASVNGSYGDFTYVSALGFMFSLVVVPLTILVKKLLEKYGPSEN